MKKIHDDYIHIQLNTVVSGCMKIFNLLNDPKQQHNQHWSLFSRVTFHAFLHYLYPVTPHLGEHLWETLSYPSSIAQSSWPNFNLFQAEASEVTITVQVNGKLRGRISIPIDSTKENAIKDAKNHDDVKKHLNERIKKVIFWPKKIINFVI